MSLKPLQRTSGSKRNSSPNESSLKIKFLCFFFFVTILAYLDPNPTPNLFSDPLTQIHPSQWKRIWIRFILIRVRITELKQKLICRIFANFHFHIFTEVLATKSFAYLPEKKCPFFEELKRKKEKLSPICKRMKYTVPAGMVPMTPYAGKTRQSLKITFFQNKVLRSHGEKIRFCWRIC